MDRKNNLSKWAILIALTVAIIWRAGYHSNNPENGYNATTWDALGYYIYLPSIFIYDDYKDLDWFPEVDQQYHLSGGEFYQATQQEDSTYVFKYLGGTAILQSPFFFIGHLNAKIVGAPQDGFSAPYQYALIWGALFWFAIGMIFLRKVLLEFYTDRVTMITLLLIALATNLLQYVSIDGVMSHVYIFPLYSLLLWWTIQWYKKPALTTALKIGLVIGLATICRPTECIMIFIPALWLLPKKGLSSIKSFLSTYRLHILMVLIGGFIGILPQLIYWKLASGNWIYNVGSKWYFLNPWWRVLFGFEKGWFIYTPITIFMIVGFFFIKNKVFRASVITFCLLNIWIIISWSDWQYGATYSTRALSHSYPVFALPLAGFVEYINSKKWRAGILAFFIYLIGVNQFQIWQYNEGILHYYDMNFKYYKAIYLDAAPTPLDYSYLDDGQKAPENQWKEIQTFTKDDFTLHQYESMILASLIISQDTWIQYKASVNAANGIRNAQWVYNYFKNGICYYQHPFRLATPGVENKTDMYYQHELLIEEGTDSIVVSINAFNSIQINTLESTLSVSSK